MSGLVAYALANVQARAQVWRSGRYTDWPRDGGGGSGGLGLPSKAASGGGGKGGRGLPSATSTPAKSFSTAELLGL